MKEPYLILLAGLGAALYLSKRPAASAKPNTNPAAGGAQGGAQEIRIEGGNGWRYFSDGTAIDPYGTYYYQGQMVYNPMM